MKHLLRVIAFVVVAAAIAACSQPGGGSSTTGSPAPSASRDPQDSAVAFARCMRENGVDMPDPQVGSDGRVLIGVGGSDKTNQSTMQAAMEKCQPLLAGLAGGPGAGGMSPDDQEKILAFAACMRAHGVNMPDPQFDPNGPTRIQPPSDFDPNSASGRAAEDACQHFLPGVGGVQP